ncbi:hypothetical protein IV203_003960 [Nitzschia inconspicua]|uniref:Uncharacterized protein n=1 Tax=Nitzschia inconspicua TaxID=303405 RepID=A0A9K3L2U3_9STRA|nr:hypothetical protein IV203_003960 [Nitzschia inconspicua]
MPAQQTYSPEEIKKWKEMIYGNNNFGVKVDEWASAETSAAHTSPRKSKPKQKWGKATDSPSSSESDWLTGESPTKTKKTYKIKGSVAAKTPF